MSVFEPELGQALFSNSPWGEVETPTYVTSGIDLLAECISGGDFSADPSSNSGCAPFANGTFEMRAYCWCDGDSKGHEQGCPPNFKCGDFEVRWYKHSHRGANQNRRMDIAEWRRIVQCCLVSLDEGAT